MWPIAAYDIKPCEHYQHIQCIEYERPIRGGSQVWKPNKREEADMKNNKKI